MGTRGTWAAGVSLEHRIRWHSRILAKIVSKVTETMHVRHARDGWPSACQHSLNLSSGLTNRKKKIDSPCSYIGWLGWVALFFKEEFDVWERITWCNDTIFVIISTISLISCMCCWYRWWPVGLFIHLSSHRNPTQRTQNDQKDEIEIRWELQDENIK